MSGLYIMVYQVHTLIHVKSGSGKYVDMVEKVAPHIRLDGNLKKGQSTNY